MEMSNYYTGDEDSKYSHMSDLCDTLYEEKRERESAIRLMRENGVHPIPMGVGRGRGNYWLVSAVDSALRRIYESAQPQARKTKSKASAIDLSLHKMSCAEISDLLTHNGPLQ